MRSKAVREPNDGQLWRAVIEAGDGRRLVTYDCCRSAEDAETQFAACCEFLHLKRVIAMRPAAAGEKPYLAAGERWLRRAPEYTGLADGDEIGAGRLTQE